MKKQKTRYYNTFSDDFTLSANQDKSLPKNYKWVRGDLFSKILSAVIYAIAVIFSAIWCKLHFRLKIIKSKEVKKIRGGCFIYANHTQPIGDVFIPALCAFPKRIYTLVSTANYGIPIIGKILPYLGALPIVNTVGGLKELNRAVEFRVQNGNALVIFPEAHVWQYFTRIRDYDATSFKYPAKLDKPVLSLTVTYKKTRFRRLPKMYAYLDGPFIPEGNNIANKAEYLRNAVLNNMKRRSEESDCEYIKYVKNTDSTKT